MSSNQPPVGPSEDPTRPAVRGPRPGQPQPFGSSQQGGQQYGYGQPGPASQQHGQQYGQPYGHPQQPSHGSGGSVGSKMWLVVVLVIVVVLAIIGLVFGALSLAGDDDSGTAVNDLESGQCLVSEDIAEGEGTIDSIDITACDREHDGEVFATIAVTEETAKDFDIDEAGALCVDELATSNGLTLDVLSSAGLEVRPLVADSEPTADDTIVCFIRHSGGEKLTEKIAE